MNILEIEDIIKGLPDQSLVQEAQAPSGQMPQFLVVSEIQRRADMRKRFQNQQQEMPQGTIAQQIVQGGIASMGNQQPIQPMPQQGMPPQGMQQPPMPPQGMPPQGMPQPPMSLPMSPPMSPPMMGQPPMQPHGMAAGGVVRMQAGELVPYTGGTERPKLRTGASYIYRDSIFNPELDAQGRKQQIDLLLENFPSTPMSRQAAISEQNIKDVYGESGLGSAVGQALREVVPYGYSVVEPFIKLGGKAVELGLGGIDLATREPARALEQLVTGEVSDTKPLFESSRTPATDSTPEITTGEAPSLESLLQYKSPLSFGDNYNIENPLNMDSNRFYETTINKDPKDLAPIISLGLSDRTAEDKVAEDMMKRPQGPDYSAAKSILDELQAVDYSAFKPDYAGLITEQERRAQKIRDDASKDASAQALIQLGAGLAAGDISKGLSAAGQSVADIKRQARSEARDEEGFARQLRLAQDEAGMQLGVKGAEAEREMARFKATYGVSLKELENTMTLARERIKAEADTEAGRMLRARIEGLGDLLARIQADPLGGDENRVLFENALSELQSLLGVSRKPANGAGDPLGLGV